MSTGKTKQSSTTNSGVPVQKIQIINTGKAMGLQSLRRPSNNQEQQSTNNQPNQNENTQSLPQQSTPPKKK